MIENDTVFLTCRYTTGDASGQNMVTIATDAVCRHLVANAPVPPLHWFIEGNFSGDKKASHLGLISGRGRKVCASVTIREETIAALLQTSSEQMLAYARVAALGAQLSGRSAHRGTSPMAWPRCTSQPGKMPPASQNPRWALPGWSHARAACLCRSLCQI